MHACEWIKTGRSNPPKKEEKHNNLRKFQNKQPSCLDLFPFILQRGRKHTTKLNGCSCASAVALEASSPKFYKLLLCSYHCFH